MLPTPEEFEAWHALRDARKDFREKSLAVFRHPKWPGRCSNYGPLELASTCSSLLT